MPARTEHKLICAVAVHIYALDGVGRYALTLVAACLTLAFEVTNHPEYGTTS